MTIGEIANSINRAAATLMQFDEDTPPQAWRDFALGLLATLGNPKAILFFGAILPTVVDMTLVKAADVLLLAGIVAAVSYAVYGACILLADRTRHLMTSNKAAVHLKRFTGTILVGSGIAVATR